MRIHEFGGEPLPQGCHKSATGESAVNPWSFNQTIQQIKNKLQKSKMSIADKCHRSRLDETCTLIQLNFQISLELFAGGKNGSNGWHGRQRMCEMAQTTSTCTCEGCGTTDNLTYIEEWYGGEWWCAECIRQSEIIASEQFGSPIEEGEAEPSQPVSEKEVSEDPQNE